MTPDTYIDTLFKKYKQAPGFPLDDWIENSVSFYALSNFWDEIFSTAAGQEKEKYVALGDAKQDPDSYIYRVINHASRKSVSVTPREGAEVGGMFYLIANTGDAGDGSDDQYDLGYVGDLDRGRLIAFFLMIRHYVSTPINDDNDLKMMENLFVETYGKQFGYESFNPYGSTQFPTAEDDDDEVDPAD